MIKVLMVSSIIALGATLTGCNTVENSNAQNQNTGNSQPHNDIKVYNSTSKIKSYKIVGRVASENYNFVGMSISQDVIMQDLKKKAARLGANAIMNISGNLTQTTAEAMYPVN